MNVSDMTRWRSAVAVAVMLLGTECYNYQPLGGSRLTPSMFVAVTLTESGSEQLAPSIGPGILVVRGRFLSASEHGLIVSVASVENRRGNVLEWKGESVVIPGEFVRALEERQGAVGKTVLLAGASLVGFFAAYASFGPGAGGVGGAGGTGSGAGRQ